MDTNDQGGYRRIERIYKHTKKNGIMSPRRSNLKVLDFEFSDDQSMFHMPSVLFSSSFASPSSSKQIVMFSPAAGQDN